MEDHHNPSIYQIRVRGHLDERWKRWFEGYTITLDPNGETVFSGEVADQASLHGTLNRIRDLGLELLSLQLMPRPIDKPAANQDGTFTGA